MARVNIPRFNNPDISQMSGHLTFLGLFHQHWKMIKEELAKAQGLLGSHAFFFLKLYSRYRLGYGSTPKRRYSFHPSTPAQHPSGGRWWNRQLNRRQGKHIFWGWRRLLNGAATHTLTLPRRAYLPLWSKESHPESLSLEREFPFFSFQV